MVQNTSLNDGDRCQRQGYDALMGGWCKYPISGYINKLLQSLLDELAGNLFLCYTFTGIATSDPMKTSLVALLCLISVAQAERSNKGHP